MLCFSFPHLIYLFLLLQSHPTNDIIEYSHTQNVLCCAVIERMHAVVSHALEILEHAPDIFVPGVHRLSRSELLTSL